MAWVLTNVGWFELRLESWLERKQLQCQVTEFERYWLALAEVRNRLR